MKYLALLVAISTFSACAHGDTGAQAESDCEIIYSPIPHKSSVDITGDDRLQAVLALDLGKQASLFRKLVPITEAFLRDSPFLDAGFTVGGHAAVTGGYEGESSSSLSIGVAVQGPDKLVRLQNVAAAMGYIYVQDSVLVICPDDGMENATDRQNFILTDIGQRPFYSPGNAALFFGMMIAVFGGPDDVGYTYYADRKRFTTLGLAAPDSTTKSRLALLASRLETIFQGAHKLHIGVQLVDVAFPHNDWGRFPAGEAFETAIAGRFDLLQLRGYRQQFFRAIDAFISSDQGATSRSK